LSFDFLAFSNHLRQEGDEGAGRCAAGGRGRTPLRSGRKREAQREVSGVRRNLTKAITKVNQQKEGTGFER